jgi:TetR/AcrR family tetracycline transcriptional repressor
MAESAMAPHATAPLPAPSDDWREWFLGNWRGLRRTLLMHRDGARLHAGSTPQGEDLSRAILKLEFLVASGLPERGARIAMLTAGQFTVGSVLEQQAGGEDGLEAGGAATDHAAAFDSGLTMIMNGLSATSWYASRT